MTRGRIFAVRRNVLIINAETMQDIGYNLRQAKGNNATTQRICGRYKVQRPLEFFSRNLWKETSQNSNAGSIP